MVDEDVLLMFWLSGSYCVDGMRFAGIGEC